MTTTQTTVSLDIDQLPECLYDLLLEEFQAQHGTKGRFVNWRITAIKETEEEA